MKLEPVYLVAPPRRITTRRAFLFAASASLAGVAVGFGLGRAAGSAGTSTSPPISPRLARALELADAATPLNELLDNDAFVLSVLHETEGAGQRHIELWRAVERLAKTVAGDAQLPQRRRHALLVLDALGKRPPPEIDLSPYLPDLKKAAGR